ncbi:phage protein [Clostridium disporicum]|uniref:Phage protein n=2 Tax=Clostridium disporicum TaxID=84024 RepID=A0A174DM13_9CLOT|nr:phage protein [Clostridium disporicum]
MLAKTIAEIHGVKLIHINELINKNIERFSINDLLDLKVIGGGDNNLLSLGFSKMQIAKSNNIYLLSERDYTKLVSLMLL